MRFSREHCWIEKTENGVKIGITDFLRNKICKSFELFLCDEGDFIRSGESLGEIISCEFIDIISPVSGKVLRVNDELFSNPPLLLEKNVWLAEFTDAAYTAPLMSETEYLHYKNNL